MSGEASIILGLVLVVGVAIVALLPLVKDGRPEAGDALHDTAAERAGLYQHILELEFDHALGRLSAADVHRLRAELLAQASALLQVERADPIRVADDVEREIAALRQSRARTRRPGRSSAVVGARP